MGRASKSPLTPRWRLALGLGSAALVLAGILLMQQSYTSPSLPTLPAGVWADVFPNPQWVLYGTLCALIGCVGAYFFLPGLLPLEEQERAWSAPEDAQPGLLFSEGWSLGAIGVLMLSAVFYVFVLVNAYGHTTGVLLLVPWIAGIALAGVALHMLTGRPDADTAPPRAAIEYLFVIAAVLAFTALNLRDLRDWHFIFWGDEWPFYDLARFVVTGGAVDPFSQVGVYGIHPLADSIYQALVMRLTETHALGWRLSSNLAAGLPIIPLYAIGRRLAGPIFACVAAFVYAACPLLWAFAHIGYNNNDPLFLMVIAALLCYRGARCGSAATLFAAGACAGGAWYSLFSGRLMIGVLGLALLTAWQGGWRMTARRIAFLLAGFAMAILPLVLDNGADTIRQMFPLISLSQARTNGAVSSLLAQNMVRGAYAFLYATVDAHYVYGEVFDVVSATALCLGVTLALRRLRALGTRLLLIWFGVGLMLTTPLYYAPQIADTRLMIAVPPAALLAAWGLCSFAGAVQQMTRPALYLSGLGAALASIWALNLHQFYGTVLDQHYHPYPSMMLIAKALVTKPDTLFVIPPDIGQLDPNRALCDIMDGYRIDAAVVLYPFPSGIRPYCSSAATATPPVLPNIFIMRDGPAPTERCAVPPSELLLEKRGTIMGYAFTLPSQPQGSYLAALTLRALQICPQLYT